MILFDGKNHAQTLDLKIKEHLKAHEVQGELAIMLIGDNHESGKYASLKERLAKRLGITVSVYKFDTKDLDVPEILARGYRTISSPKVKSCIVQLPLPSPKLYSLLDKIPENKDIDVLSTKAREQTLSDEFPFKSPVVRACEYFLGSNDIKLAGKRVLVLGSGQLVGKPLALYLKKQGANVTVVEDYAQGVSLNCDFIVSGVGKPNFLLGEDIKAGCNVIDFGSSLVNGKTVGDLDMSSKLTHLGVVSPSPGGMGPLVIRFLFMNHLGI